MLAAVITHGKLDPPRIAMTNLAATMAGIGIKRQSIFCLGQQQLPNFLQQLRHILLNFLI
jgi:hypothetical protein